MPFITIKLLAGRTTEQKAAMARTVTEAATQHLGATPEKIFVFFEDMSPEDYAPQGKLVAQNKPK